MILEKQFICHKEWRIFAQKLYVAKTKKTKQNNKKPPAIFPMSTDKMVTCFILQRSSTALPVRKVMEVTLFYNRQGKQ